MAQHHAPDVIDQELKLEELITKVLANSFNIDGYLDELALAYWVSKYYDERRTIAIHDLIATAIGAGRIALKVTGTTGNGEAPMDPLAPGMQEYRRLDLDTY